MLPEGRRQRYLIWARCRAIFSSDGASAPFSSQTPHSTSQHPGAPPFKISNNLRYNPAVLSGSAAISISGLTKRYRGLIAVNHLDLEVRRGEIFGFLGLNGAGKTTTIRILLDLLRPTSGHAAIFGHDCQSDSLEARAAIGYLPGEMGVYSNLTGHELLTFLAKIGGATVSGEHRRSLTQRFELSERDLSRKLREYSTGMKRKLGLIQAFQADPQLLILDEPTEGLDPLMQEAFYELLADARHRGRTVFMSSHVLPEVERVCDRIAVLRKGEVVLLSSVEDTRKLAPRRVRVSFQQDVSVPASLPQRYEMLDAKPRTWILSVTGQLGSLPSFLASLPVADLAVEESRLEDVLVKYYRDGAE